MSLYKMVRSAHGIVNPLAEKFSDKRTSYIGHRHVTRILSDHYGRGIVRSNQESTNLRTYIRRGDVTSAGSIKTNKNIVLPAAGALRLVEQMNRWPTDKINDRNRVRMEFDGRDKFNTTIITKNAAYLYACRPLTDKRAAELPYLSLYIFP